MLKYKELEKAVDDYTGGFLSKNELCKWSGKTYYEFLTTQFLNIEWIYMYPFIRRFSEICLSADEKNDAFPCSDSEMNDLINVIKGNNDLLFTFRLTIPWQLRQMDKFKEIYYEYEIIKKEPEKLLNEQNSAAHRILTKHNDADTVIDLIEFKIANILSEMMNEEQHTCLIDLFYNSKNQYGTKRLIDLLVKYVDCILGEKGIIIEMSYRHGKPDINIYPDS